MLKSIKICKVYVQSFPGARLHCMSDYEKPLMRGKPDHSIAHVGTNDINSEVSSKSIAESILDLAVSLKAEWNDASVSFKPKSYVFERFLGGAKFVSDERHKEAVIQRCSVKQVFFEISQNSQANTCIRVSFLIKLQA